MQIRNPPRSVTQNLMAEPVRSHQIPAPGRRKHFTQFPELLIGGQRVCLSPTGTQAREERDNRLPADVREESVDSTI